jgi:hypothetical protein
MFVCVLLDCDCVRHAVCVCACACMCVYCIALHCILSCTRHLKLSHFLLLLLLPSVGPNKGGVGVALRVGATHIAFIAAHLAAHQGRTVHRNADVAEICNYLRLPGGASGADAVTGHHHIVWLGDLNYRLEYGQQVCGHCATLATSNMLLHVHPCLGFRF